MDKIFIQNLRVPALIGVFAEERLSPQDIFIDLEAACDVERAARSDDVKDTVDYQAVTVCLIEFIEESSYQLVETLAQHLADLVINKFHVSWVKIRIKKHAFDIQNADAVGVEIERTRAK